MMEQAAVFSMTFDPRVSEDIVPSLILLFTLFLRGSLDAGAGVAAPSIHMMLTPAVDRRSARSAGALPLACLSVGIALTSFTESGWAHAVGIVCPFVFFATIAVTAADSLELRQWRSPPYNSACSIRQRRNDQHIRREHFVWLAQAERLAAAVSPFP